MPSAWHEYKQIFLTDKRIESGVKFWHENEGALAYAHKVYGVPEEVIVAIIGVETYYGRITGKHRVIDALYTLAFEYPKRAKFFRSELKHYFRLCKEQGIDPLSLTGSYAGAMGLGQFMPSSYREYAVNFDGKDNIDIWNNRVDAIGSVANYFRRHGWKKNEPVITEVTKDSSYQFNTITDRENNLKPQLTLQEFSDKGIVTELTKSHANEKASLIALEEKSGYQYWLGLNNFYSITRYNHSHMYAMSVHLLSQEIKKQFTSKK
ncbi:MAG: lytic murein transglycosylase B [Gammaproteobacteria bacterium]|nr:lytic murein transglycosylase B [Gammaproteobacteria bacterium]